MSRASASRSHLSIGEVLSLLQDEFPDVTISKIRFLESQGLLDPERTPSGYRKFYEADIERLRWILRQQKDNYLPLRVIRDRLDDVGASSRETDAPGAGVDPPAGTDREPDGGVAAAAGRVDGLDGAHRPGPSAESPASRGATARPARPAEHRSPPPLAARHGESPSPARPRHGGVAVPGGGRPTRPDNGLVTGSRRRPGGPAAASALGAERPGEEADPACVSLTIEELAQASGLSVRQLRELEHFGLLPASDADPTGAVYDGDALTVARVAGGFLHHGIEARHLRSYRVAVDREAGIFEQIVAPLLKQRNPEAHRRAARTVAELMALGEALRGALLRRELRDHLER